MRLTRKPEPAVKEVTFGAIGSKTTGEKICGDCLRLLEFHAVRRFYDSSVAHLFSLVMKQRPTGPRNFPALAPSPHEVIVGNSKALRVELRALHLPIARALHHGYRARGVEMRGVFMQKPSDAPRRRLAIDCVHVRFLLECDPALAWHWMKSCQLSSPLLG